MPNNQLARRNLTDAEFTYYIGKKYESEKQIVTNPDGINQYSDEVIRQNGGQPTETAVKIAKQYKVSPRTVERAAQLSKAKKLYVRFKKSHIVQKVLYKS